MPSSSGREVVFGAEPARTPPWTCSNCRLVNDVSFFYCIICDTPRAVCDDDDGGDEARGFAESEGILPREITHFVGALVNFVPDVNLPGIVNYAVSRALTASFAVLGACTGAMAGAIAGRATNNGLFRGAGLGAIAGAVVSVEALEASRALWRNARQARHELPPRDYIEEILEQRYVEGSMGAAQSSRRWQVDLESLSYDELYELFGPGRLGVAGLSLAQLAKLPCLKVTADGGRDANGDKLRCAICLQDMERGETARGLPRCRHLFHRACVDKWLSIHGACPVCRQHVEC